MVKLNKKGFTLVELVVTVLIVIVVAGYAIIAYIESVQDAENKSAISKMEVINNGYERFKMIYPTKDLSSAEALKKVTGDLVCDLSDDSQETLIHCGFIPNYGFDKDKYEYYLQTPKTAQCGSGYAFVRAKKGENVGKHTGKCWGYDSTGKVLEGGTAYADE